MELFLQIFLLLNVFLMGALTTVAVRHARAHFKPEEKSVEKPHPESNEAKGGHLPPAVKERLLRDSRNKFQDALDRSSEELLGDLKATAEQLNKEFEKLGIMVASNETKRYQDMLEYMRRQAETAIGNAQSEIGRHQQELKAKMAEEVEAEKQRLIAQIDTKLADAVASFLTDTLKNNVDLGAQTAYLKSVLEEHKDELKQRVAEDETPTSK
jgi:F0F1-type ATP synthase membrane subunit b/b'